MVQPGRPQEAHRDDTTSLNFMVVDDWGGQDDPPYYTDPERDVAKQMGVIAAASMGAQFTLSMGDNFYDSGVTNVDDRDPRFKETFEVKYMHGDSYFNYLKHLCCDCTRNNRLHAWESTQ